MSTPEIVGFIISIVSLLYLFVKNLNSQPKTEPLDDDEFLGIVQNKTIEQVKKEWRDREKRITVTQKAQPKLFRKNVPPPSELYKANQKPLRAKIPKPFIPEENGEPPVHSNIQNVMARLSSLPDMVIYHEILSKPKGLRDDE